MILRNFISLRAFTVYMENSLRFEVSLRILFQICIEVSFTPPEVMFNADNEVILHRSEFLPRSEISNRSEFTLGLM